MKPETRLPWSKTRFIVFVTPIMMANIHFLDHPMTFSEVCPHLKLSESVRIFFQPRHIVCALGVKIVAEARRAAEMVELERGKKLLPVTTVFFAQTA